jgi:hypothetical protein
MADIFASIVSKLLGLGFFNFLTFILAMTLIYALLRQRKIFGESPLINGLISFSIAFFIFAYPIISGISLSIPITTFFSQAFVFILIFFIGILIASFFYPDFPKALEGFFKTRNTLFAMIALSIALFVTSGLVGIIYGSFIGGPSAQPGKPSAPPEIILLIAGLIIAVVVLLIAGSVGRGGG